jgi:UDP-arabinose 4-epimerase
MNKTILVTGGAGYIGSHACKALSQAGYTPVVYDNLAYGHEWAVKWGPLERGDVTDKQRLDEVFRRYRPEAVMHFAAYAYVGESVENPGKYYRNNVVGSLTLLEAMRDHGVDKIVFSSTCATYGMPEVIPIPENHQQKPINPYGASKLMVERMLQDFNLAYGIRSISLRYFNAAGADPDCEIGEDHDPETHLIPLAIHAALGLSDQIKIYGADYPTKDGTCIRDYIHVCDLADAHIKALEYLISSNKSDSFNLGNGNGYSVREIIDKVKKISRKDFKVVETERREGDPPTLISSYGKAEEKLNWNQEYKDIDTIIETAWQWHSINARGSE